MASAFMVLEVNDQELRLLTTRARLNLQELIESVLNLLDDYRHRRCRLYRL